MNVTQYQFARLLNTQQSTVYRWRERGYLVLDDAGLVDVEASKARLIEKRGSIKPGTNRENSRKSGWSMGPNCKTASAFLSFRRIRHGG